MPWFGFTVVTGIVFLLSLGKYKKSKQSGWQLLLLIVLGYLFGIALLSPLFYEYPGTYPRTVVVIYDQEGSLEIHPYGALAIEWLDHVNHIPIGEYSFLGGVTGETSNPKSRRINYSLEAWIDDIPLYLSRSYRLQLADPTIHFGDACYRTLESEQSPIFPGYAQKDLRIPKNQVTEIGHFVRSAMNRFEDEESARLVLFNDPIDPDQYEEMRRLVEDWFNSRLEKEGIRVRFIDFTVD